MAALKEKRRAARVPVSMKVGDASDPKTIGFGYAQNISELGLAIDAQALQDPHSLPELGSEIQMRFKLPKSHAVISVRGKVVRLENGPACPWFALEFLDLNPDFRSEILEYIDREIF